MNVNQLLQESVYDIPQHKLDVAKELQEKGLIKDIQQEEYIFCISPNDEDYFEVKDIGCNERVKIDSSNSHKNTTCPGCGRNIELWKKNPGIRFVLHRDNEGVYTFVREKFSEGTGGTPSKYQNGVKYLDRKLSPAFKLSTTDSDIPVIIQFDYSDTEVLDAMQVFNGPVVVVLVGEAVPQKGEYDQRGITCVTISDILESELDYTSLCKSWYQNETPPKILAKTGIDLYENNRSRYTWREFEHTVQHCFSSIFETSRLLGGEESGEQVPEGVLSLDYGDDSHAYIWDAKYVNEPDTSRSLSGEYENMSKHLIDFRKESNVKEIYSDVSGFLIVSPRISGSSVVRLAERIQRRLAENGDSWNGAVTHLRFNSLIQLFEDFQSNRDNVQSKPFELRRHVHRLFTQSNYHEEEPEEYTQSDQRVFDVSNKDIDSIFNQYITHQEPNSDRINIDGYLANIRSLDF